MIVSVRAPQLPGPSSVPSSRIVVHGFAPPAASARCSSGATSPGPSRSTSASSQASRGTDAGSVGRCRKSRVEHVGRLLVGEDALEHVVAPHGHVAGSHVRQRGQGGERDEADDTAAPHVEDGEEPQGEEQQVGGEHGADERPVDRGRGPAHEREPGQHRDGGQPDEDEPAPAGTEVELPGAGHEHREH